jgi:tRNA (cytidine/uridine-2'-O-)-methyltransferase
MLPNGSAEEQVHASEEQARPGGSLSPPPVGEGTGVGFSRELQKLDLPLNVVLVEPQIPPNTGNIARLCACTGSRLHLVGPLGFSIGDSDLKRAGLDYWADVFQELYSDLDAFLAKHGQQRLHLFSARGERSYFEARFQPGDFLVLGAETKGLPKTLLDSRPEQVWAVPMLPQKRSLNLSTCAGIVVYEALRQLSGNFGERGPAR